MGSNAGLNRLFALEQLAFLRRPRKHWNTHLNLAREFIATALKTADPSRPILILGAGWGLEIPWRLAPKSTVGWDADPWSRLGTFFRHFRWAPWVFKDITGTFQELARVSRRVQTIEGRLVRRPVPVAAKRLAGLLPSVIPSPMALETWIQNKQPSTIICANILGQIKPMASKIIEVAFKPNSPWVIDPELPDSLNDALDVWVARVLKCILGIFQKSGSNLYLLHDRGVIHQDADLALGEWEDSWIEQIKSIEKHLEASDPLSGVDMLVELNKFTCHSKKRWIWPLGSKQIHIVEALVLRP
ncbi:MAG: hypothetical protein FWG02_08345 [Holophagaceae bacterium]|nr:hypothetical protein [Holophagaceae bacterium]